jgi:hypothetical protein
MPFMRAVRPSPACLLRRSAVAAALVFALALVILAPGSSARAASDTTVGSIATFWAENWTTKQYSQIQATARFVGDHVVVYVANSALFTDAAASSLGDAFDSTVYPLLTSAYGFEPNPGIDGGERVAILVYDFHDYLPGSVDGSFNPADIDPGFSSNGSAPAPSNQREMFYLNAQALSLDPGSAVALAAHEFAHLIIHYQDVMLDPYQIGSAEAKWLEEGLASYAEHLCGYDERANSMLQLFTSDPDVDLTYWGNGDWPHYGASYSFVSYLAGREGSGFIKALVQEPLDGVAGINAVLERLSPFDDFNALLHDWVLAGFLDSKLPQLWPYVFSELDVRVRATGLVGSSPIRGDKQVKNYGAVYLTFPETDRSAVFQVVVDGADGAPLHAAAVSWDSAGVLYPDVRDFDLANPATGGVVDCPGGYDRHTLVVWSRGTVGSDVSFRFKYSGTPDPPGGVQFLDKGGSDPYYSEVAHLLVRGVIGGYEIPVGSGLWFFKGSNNVTRAQFAKMIMLAIGMHTEQIDNPDKPSFKDVGPYDAQGNIQSYPYDFVEEAAALKVVGGYVDGRFLPAASITRGQLVAMIARGARAAGKPLPPYSGDAKIFADVPVSRSPDSLYMNVMSAYNAGILNGTRVNGVFYFNPSSSATRDHVAIMTDRLMRYMEAYAPPGL